LQRACGTSLETAIILGLKIAAGQIDSAIAAGVDTASDAPIGINENLRRILLRSARGRSLGQRLAPWASLRPGHWKPSFPAVSEPRTGLTMGQSTELMAGRWGITREAQDQLAYESHRRAAAAYDAGFFDDLVFPTESRVPDAGQWHADRRQFDPHDRRSGCRAARQRRMGAGPRAAGAGVPDVRQGCRRRFPAR
jgi:acetyl-CoA acetyltransferase